MRLLVAFPATDGKAKTRFTLDGSVTKTASSILAADTGRATVIMDTEP